MFSHDMLPRLPSQWQSDADLPNRRRMVKVIIGILVSEKDQHVLNSIRTVIPIAKQVELDLYKRAHDLAAYNEVSTLEERVREVVQASQTFCAGRLQWQSDKDLTARRRMIKLITIFLRKELEAEDMADISSLIMKVARYVEASMYQSAPCFIAYADERTLESRIRLMQVARLPFQR